MCHTPFFKGYLRFLRKVRYKLLTKAEFPSLSSLSITSVLLLVLFFLGVSCALPWTRRDSLQSHGRQQECPPRGTSADQAAVPRPGRGRLGTFLEVLSVSPGSAVAPPLLCWTSRPCLLHLGFCSSDYGPRNQSSPVYHLSPALHPYVWSHPVAVSHLFQY